MTDTAKKGFLILVFAFLVSGGVFAQSAWYNSYAAGVADDTLFIDGGFAFSASGGYTGFPPVWVNADVKLPVSLPITLGVLAAFSSYTWSDGWQSVTYRSIGVAGRASYHFNFIDRLDTYAGFIISLFGFTQTSIEGGDSSGYVGSSGLAFGVDTGLRFFFTDIIGVYGEVGILSSSAFASVGLSIKI